MDPKYLTLLRIHDACRGLSDDEIDTLASKAHVELVEAGELIHSAGQEVRGLFLVGAGQLKLILQSPDGEQQTIRYVGAGDQFGALLLIANEGFPLNVVVEEKSVLFRFDPEDAGQFADAFPVFRRNLLRKLGLGLKDTLLKQRKRTPSKVVAFINTGPSGQRIVSRIATRLASIGEKVAILGDSENPLIDPQIPYQSIRGLSGEFLSVPEIRTMVREMSKMDRIFIEVEAFHPVEKMDRLIELSDTIYCFAPTSDPKPALDELEKLITRSPSWRKKMHFIWIMDEHEQVAPYAPELTHLVERDFKVNSSQSTTMSGLAAPGIERIVHYLRGVSVGIALSGGAAHGMTHLGVLKALEESGITLDKMSGTSAGVLTGVIYGAGYSPDWGIQHFTKDLQPGTIFRHLPMGSSFYMLKQYRFRSWKKMLRKYLQDWRMEQFPLPVSTITTDLVSAKSIVRESGNAVDSILESINLPVISAPICRDGMLLVDGGVLNNLPADVLAKQGCNFILGVDVSANIEQRVGNNTPDTPTLAMRSPGAISTLLRSLAVQAHNMSGVGAQSADVIIAPDVSKFDSTAFTETPAMAKIGYQTTLDAIPKIRKFLHQLDASLFTL